MTGVITNIQIVCVCGKKISSWSAPEQLNNAVVMGSKLNGITVTQLERFLLSLNFVAEGKKYRIFRKLSYQRSIGLNVLVFDVFRQQQPICHVLVRQNQKNYKRM